MTFQRRGREAWTDEEILRESERWVHVPPAGTPVRDGRRLLVLLPAAEGPSRVWRSWPDRSDAENLISATIETARAHGAARLVWHTGDAVSPPLMDDLLAKHGFEKTEDLEVLAFELGTGPRPNLPRLGIPRNVRTWPVEDAPDLRRAHAIEATVFPNSAPAEPNPEPYLRGLSALRDGAQAAGASPPRAFKCLASLSGPPNDGSDARGTAVSTAGAELAGETLRLWGAATLPEYRRRGAYRALVAERCRYAHALGATLALTKANTATSAPTLRAAGFRTVATERRHALEISPETPPPTATTE